MPEVLIDKACALGTENSLLSRGKEYPLQLSCVPRPSRCRHADARRARTSQPAKGTAPERADRSGQYGQLPVIASSRANRQRSSGDRFARCSNFAGMGLRPTRCRVSGRRPITASRRERQDAGCVGTEK